MKFKFPFGDDTLKGMMKNFGIAMGIILFISISYFYIYLPYATHHGESLTVPNLIGMQMEELETFLAENNMRYEVNDSSYTDTLPPLAVTRQFPNAGEQVKSNRKIFVSVNRVSPPTVPIPDLVNDSSISSRINAEVVLRSNELKIGRIILEPSPFLNLVKELRYKGKPIAPGTRVPKGSAIDLVVGDGNGPADFTIGDLIGDTFTQAKFKLAGWNLHLGSVQIPEDIDTTGMETFVYKQFPAVGDSVRVGDPVDLWIGPKGYEEPVEEVEGEESEGGGDGAGEAVKEEENTENL